MSKAEERALEAYPPTFTSGKRYAKRVQSEKVDTHAPIRSIFIKGYEQAEKDILAIVKKYLEKGSRCIEESTESRIYSFWDGFLNCAENILRELEEEK